MDEQSIDYLNKLIQLTKDIEEDTIAILASVPIIEEYTLSRSLDKYLEFIHMYTSCKYMLQDISNFSIYLKRIKYMFDQLIQSCKNSNVYMNILYKGYPNIPTVLFSSTTYLDSIESIYLKIKIVDTVSTYMLKILKSNIYLYEIFMKSINYTNLDIDKYINDIDTHMNKIENILKSMEIHIDRDSTSR